MVNFLTTEAVSGPAGTMGMGSTVIMLIVMVAVFINPPVYIERTGPLSCS